MARPYLRWTRVHALLATIAAVSLTLTAGAPLVLAADTTPPSVPTGLKGTAEPNRIVKLTWKASTDNAPGTITYRVFRGGTAIGSRTSQTSYVDQPAVAGTYRYQVRAIDAVGNRSALSASIYVSAAESPPDTTPPSTPTGLSGAAEGHLAVRLSWNASTDNAPGTLSYRVVRNGTAIGSKTTATSFTDTPPTAGSYRYQVRAIDAAGNRSPLSPAVTVVSVDTLPPAVPGDFTAVAGAQGQAMLSWSPAADDQPGTVRYIVLRNGLRVGTTTATSAPDYATGRLPASYDYQVMAMDVAGNVGGPSASASVSVEPAGFPWAGVLYRNGDRERPRVALTFDDCYNTNNVRQIVLILRQHNVGGTFFCVGEAIDKDPALYADIVRTFPMGNHTWNHPNLNNQTDEVIISQLTVTTDRIEEATRWTMAPIMRAPGGYADSRVREVIGRLGLPIIRWDIDTQDYVSTRTSTDVYNSAIKATNGSIVLMHDRAKTVAALPDIITTLKSRGYQLVTVPELLGLPWQPALP